MKKLSYKTIILAAACLLLPGCADDAADAIEQPVTPPTAELVGDSEVEIKLSSSSSTMLTRAGVYEGTNGFYTTKWMGIFCLADEKLIQSAEDIDWSRSSTTSEDVHLDNVGAMVTDGQLSFTGGATYYYPMSNKYRYRFYGYYTRQTEVVTKEPEKVTVGVTFKGNDDILWGKSEMPQDTYEKYAYSAKYYREHIKDVTTEAAIPTIGFEHVMTCLEFSVIAKDESAKNLTISSIKLLNAPQKLNLVLATKSHVGEGVIEIDETSDATVNVDLMDVKYTLDEETGKLTYETPVVTSVPITDEEAIVGVSETDLTPAAFYVFPQREHLVRVEMKGFGKTFTYDMPVQLPEGDTYAGHKYKLKLQVYGPQQITLNTTLEPWVYDEETDDDIEIEL